jgi:hypothetical protein
MNTRLKRIPASEQAAERGLSPFDPSEFATAEPRAGIAQRCQRLPAAGRRREQLPVVKGLT